MMQLFRVTLPVSDINHAARFYSGLLGIPGERIGIAWHYFQCGQAILACYEAAAEREMPAPPHQAPLVLALDDRLDNLLIRARNFGATDLDSHVMRLPSGESGFRMRDPFGNALWIIEARSMLWNGRSAGRGVSPVTMAAPPPPAEIPVMLFQRDFLNAVKGGELSRVKELLMLDPELIDCCDATGVSALMLAAYKRHEHVAAYLFSQRSNLNQWEAAAFGARSALQSLLSAKPEMVNAPAVDGYLALGLAAFFGHAPCVELLLALGAEVNAVSRNAMHARPLHSAVTQAPAARALAVVELLLQAGAEVNVGKSGGYTPLHLAVNRDECEIAELLLCSGADMNLRAGDGRSAWHVAQVRSHPRMLALFEAYRAKQAAVAF